MKRYNEKIEISNELMDTIGSYMDDDIREDVHAELAPCTAEEFLTRYLELDKDFIKLLEIEFDIEVEKTYYVINNNGELICHDVDFLTAENCLSIMQEEEPDAGWEMFDSDDETE